MLESNERSTFIDICLCFSKMLETIVRCYVERRNRLKKLIFQVSTIIIKFYDTMSECRRIFLVYDSLQLQIEILIQIFLMQL